MEVAPVGRWADLMEVGLEVLKVAALVDRLEDLMEVAPVVRSVGHLEGARVLQMYRDFLLRALAPRQEFLPLLLGPLPQSLLVQEFLLLAESALLWELFQALPYLLGHQMLRQTYHLLQRFFHLL